MFESRETQYSKAYKSILSLIEQNGYQENERLPAIQKMADMFGVSKISVQHAVKELHRESILSSVPKGGTYLCRKPGIVDTKEYNYHGMEVFSVPGIKSLTFQVVDSWGPYLDVLKRIVNAYQKKNPLVKIKIKPGTIDSKEKTKADLLQISSLVLPYYVRAGLLYDPNKTGCRLFKNEDFYESIVDGVSCNQKIWGAPGIVSPSIIYWHTKYAVAFKRFNQSGDFWAQLKELTSLANKFPAKCKAALVNNCDILTFLLMSGECQSLLCEDIIRNIQGNREFFKRFAAAWQNPRLFYWPEKLNINEFRRSFINGLTPALFCRHNPAFLKSHPDFAVSEYDIGVWNPAPGGYIPIQMTINCIASKSRFPLECAEFLSFIASHEAQSMFADAGIWCGRNDMMDIYTKKHPDTAWDALEKATVHGRVMCSTLPHINNIITQIVNTEMFKFSRKQLSVESALQRIVFQSKYYNNSLKVLEKKNSQKYPS